MRKLSVCGGGCPSNRGIKTSAQDQYRRKKIYIDVFRSALLHFEELLILCDYDTVEETEQHGFFFKRAVLLSIF